jgi:RimJ/RimL family protein N-acetyltransferase
MPERPDLRLRSIVEDDLETLRLWKNAHRQFFFFQEVIVPEQQRFWFQQFRTREHDYMFMVRYRTVDIGCMGFRLLDGKIDIYNVILGRKEHANRGIMSMAMCLMNGFAALKFTEEITARVLRTNPALAWYLKNGFELVETFETYYLVRLTDRVCRYRVCYKPSKV